MNNYVEMMSDEELELLVGGEGSGAVPTLTKDCPNVVSKISISIGPIEVEKSCEK